VETELFFSFLPLGPRFCLQPISIRTLTATGNQAKFRSVRAAAPKRNIATIASAFADLRATVSASCGLGPSEQAAGHLVLHLAFFSPVSAIGFSKFQAFPSPPF
jgi:hypothetical protein